MCVFHYNPVYVSAKSLREHPCMRHGLYISVWSEMLNVLGGSHIVKWVSARVFVRVQH